MEPTCATTCGRPRHRALAVLAAVAVLGTVTGCGGKEQPSGPTRAEYVARAEQVCRTADKQLRPALAALVASVGDVSRLTPARERQLVPRVERLHGLGLALLTRLRALERPAGDDAAIARVLTPVAQMNAKIAEAGDALGAGQTTVALAALAEIARLSEEAQQAAEDYGLPVCGSTVSLDS